MTYKYISEPVVVRPLEFVSFFAYGFVHFGWCMSRRLASQTLSDPHMQFYSIFLILYCFAH